MSYLFRGIYPINMQDRTQKRKDIQGPGRLRHQGSSGEHTASGPYWWLAGVEVAAEYWTIAWVLYKDPSTTENSYKIDSANSSSWQVEVQDFQ